ncbi:hypothetical protein [Mucilaginibacter sp.]
MHKYKGNKVAGPRLRKTFQKVKSIADIGRNEVSIMKKQEMN